MPTTIDLIVEDPILLDLTVTEPIYIVYNDIVQTWSDETFLIGDKATGVDAGKVPQFSITNDWLYVCVTAGVAGVAVWKRLPLNAI
jgi:hypothetical protein